MFRIELKYFLIASAIVHGSLLFFVTNPRVPTATDQSTAAVQPIMVEHVFVGSGERGTPGRPGDDRGRLRMSHLMPQFKNRQGPSALAPSGEVFSSEKIWNGRFSTTHTLNEIIDSSFYRYLVRKIDESLQYPKDLIDHGEQGVVRADLYFSPNRHLDLRRSRIRTSSRFLRVVVLRALRPLREEPLPINYRLPANGVHVPCIFEFSIVLDVPSFRPDEKMSPLLPLHFSRVHRKKLPIQFGAASVGGVPQVSGNLNVGWLFEQAESLFAKDGERSLENYRNDPDW